MRRTTVTSTLSAAALLVLSGCTITVNSNSSEPARRPATAQSSTAKTSSRNPRVTRKPATGSTTRPSTSGSSTSGSTVDLTPRITSPIAFGNGTGGAFTGHAYVIPETTSRMPDLGAMIPFATLFTDSFNVGSQRFEGGFPGALVQEDWFALRYEGRFTLAKDGETQFKLVSDDGAILYVDGQKVVDNDGKHSAKTVTGKRDLKAGSHTLRLDYFQAEKGAVALQLYLVERGKETLLTGTK